MKKTNLAVGISSGTSADGVDTVLIKISGNGIGTKLKVVDFVTYKYPERLRAAILRNSDDKTAKLSEVCSLNAVLGRFFARAVGKICRKNGLVDGTELKIDFIGSHGQTIYHLPYGSRIGRDVRSTLQIGDPSVIAALTGITTVGDFRMADCAVGGHGAPLTPYLDYILFRSGSLNRGLLNIGGIANITAIPRSSSMDDVRAFDTGPGNMLIDGLTKPLCGKDFDRDGNIASRGTVDSTLMAFLRRESFYRTRPPKSAGREVYGADFQNEIIRRSGNLPPEDLIRTVTEFTGFAVAYNYDRFIKGYCKLDELIVSGGGVWNKVLMNSLENRLKGVAIQRLSHDGISPDSKEAVLFAVLANECLAGNRANIRSVTGAKKNVILGKICPGQ